ncbi:hypothetical protein GW796_06710 [archaeon]|nr:hypothetical protein [archaeon]
MKNYLFANIEDKQLNSKFISIIFEFSSIHLNFKNHLFEDYDYFNNILFDLKLKFPNKQFFLYCHNIEMVLAAKNNKFIPHYCFTNDGLKNNLTLLNLMEQDIEAEVFWILDEKILNYSVDECLSWIQNTNRAICPTFSGNLINTNILNFEKIREHVMILHHKFSNPLFKKEEHLHVSNWEYNSYVFQQNNTIYFGNIILGMFGDIYVEDLNTIDKTNIKSLLKNNSCQKCDFFDKCKERGIGYIINSLNLNGCISYKLLNGTSNEE